MQSALLYDYVDVLEDEMADAMEADAERSDQSTEAQEDRAAGFLVERAKLFERTGKPFPWAKIAAYALAVGGQQRLEEAPEPGEDEISF